MDVWQSDSEGFYDVQRTDLKEPQLRARFHADDDGRVRFWTIMPTAYPIPYDGPVGEMLKATERHPWRPAHLHFMAASPGYTTLVTHVFVDGDKYLDSDAVFGVKESLIDAFPEQPAGQATPEDLPQGRVVVVRGCVLDAVAAGVLLAGQPAGQATPDGRAMKGPWRRLDYEFRLSP